VLAATLNGIGKFQPLPHPQNLYPWTDQQKMRHSTPTKGPRIPNLVQIRRLRASGQMGEI